jgi:hypothetical protein
MAAVTDGAQPCAYCGTPIVRFETVVEIDGIRYCCPNCELAAQNPERSQRARRGGGLVLTCTHCGTPIIVSEIMVHADGRSYCCLNCAEVVRQGAAVTAVSHG